MPNYRSKHRLTALIICAAAILSACSGNTQTTTAKMPESAPAQTTALAAEDTVSAPQSEEDTEQADSSDDEEASEAPEAPETSEASKTAGDGGASPDEAGADDPENDGTSAESEETADQPPDTEAPEIPGSSGAEEAPQAENTAAPPETPPQSETTTVTTTAETTTTTATTTAAAATTTTAAAVKHDPSPPRISKVSSDGTDTFSDDRGVIDYSNASKGYISAKYTGKKKDAMIQIVCGSDTYDYVFGADGKYHYFNLSSGSGDYSVKLYENAGGELYSKVTNGTFSVKIADEVTQYTYTNEFIGFDENSACVAKAAEVCGGCASDVEKVAAIFSYVTENISYDYDLAATITTFYTPDPDTTLRTKKGVCFDYSSLMAAMLRSQGIPTRLLIGYAGSTYHAWNEVYTSESGWITFEILFKDKGFALLDSTYYSTSNDKKWISDYMSNKGNYKKIYTY